MREIGRIVETTLNILPPEISADVAKNGILITGGFSGIVGLERYLRTTLNLPIIIAEDAPNACILGAGKLLANLNELKRVLIRIFYEFNSSRLSDENFERIVNYIYSFK